jgi:hypothetical protein
MLIVIDGVCCCDQCGRDHIVVPSGRHLAVAGFLRQLLDALGHVCDTADVRAHEAKMAWIARIARECVKAPGETPLPACKVCGFRDETVSHDGLGMLICRRCDDAALDAANRYEEDVFFRQEQEGGRHGQRGVEWLRT